MAKKILMLALSPTMEIGTIVDWRIQEGAAFTTGEVLCEVETDKATMDYEATSSGTLLKIVAVKGAKVHVGDVIGISGEAGEDVSSLVKTPSASPEAPKSVPGESVTKGVLPPAADSKEKAIPSPATPFEHLPNGVKASPLARSIARVKGVSLAQITGSGPGGRIVKADVEKVLAHTTDDVSIKNTADSTEDVVTPVSGVRQIIADRLTASKMTSPHFYLTVKVGMDELLSARSHINRNVETKVSFNAFIIKLVAAALRKNPRVNASWHGETIIEHGRVDIALAVAQPEGLITPVVRDVVHKGIAVIDTELHGLIDRARNGKLTPQEYTGSTFTISNLGSYGVHEFTAIINPPNAAILAIGEIFREPYEGKNGAVEFRSVMHCTLSCDHRLVDGATAALFARDLKNLFEQPLLALM